MEIVYKSIDLEFDIHYSQINKKVLKLFNK